MTHLTKSIYFQDSQKELEELLIKNMPTKIKGGSNKENSNIFDYPTKVAIHKCNFIHFNSSEQISFIVFDFDKVGDKEAISIYPTIAEFWQYLIDIVVIEPTFITQTSKGYQFAYHLKNHIFTHQKKPLNYLHTIKSSIIERVGCDKHGSVRNSGIWRNPLRHEYYYSECFNYALKDFNHLILPQKTIQQKFQKTVMNRQIDGGILKEGNRNNGLFYLGMRYAKNKKNLEIFQIKQYLNSANILLEKPLENMEVETISKSIYNNYYMKNKIFVKGEIQKKDINEGVMEFEKIKNLSYDDYKREVKRRQSLSAQRTNEILKNKTTNLEKARKVYRQNTFALNIRKVREAERELLANDEKINISKIARITKLDRKTVKKYLNFPKP